MFVVEDVDFIEKKVATNLQTMTMCQVTGARLTNHTIDTSSTRGVNDCVKLCVRNPGCVSLNYIVSSETCELNNAVSSDYRIRKFAEYDDQLTDDYIHYTSQSKCSDTY